MTDRSLTDTLELSGEWYLSQLPHTKIAGQVRFASGRVELALHGAFTPLNGDVAVTDKRPVYAVVHGISSTGDALTIINAQQMGVNFHMASAGVKQSERLLSSQLLIGGHVKIDQLYKHVNFRVPGLEVWLSKPVIKEEQQLDAASEKLSFTYHFSPNVSESVLVPAIDATIMMGVTSRSSVNVFKSISVDVVGCVRITPTSPRPLDWFLEQQRKLETMLAFLAGTPMPADSISAYVDDSHRAITVMIATRLAPKCKYAHPNDFFILLSNAGVGLSELLSTWFEKIDKVYIPSQLALSVLSSSNLWLHVEFASLMQALEGFHRALYDGDYMDESDYASVKSALTKAIPDSVGTDHKEALRSRIKYGNQISLPKRLKELVDSFDAPLSLLIFGREGKVPRSWIDTRNYHSHWDEELKPNIVDGQNMYNANIRMKHFIRALYLMFMGVPVATIVKCLSNSSDTSQHLIQLNIIEMHKVDPSLSNGIYMTVGKVPIAMPPQSIATETSPSPLGDESGQN